MTKWVWLLVAVLALASFEAGAARRLGGGTSIGRQSGNVTQREATRNSAPSNTQNATPAQPVPAGAAATAPRRPWGAMLGGLAAGLGLAWLAHSLGLGEAFGEFMLIALVVLAAMAAIGWFMRPRRRPGGLAFEAAGSAPADLAEAPRQYSPDKVGNDASARPWERSSMAFDASKYAPAGSGVQIGSALAAPQATWGIPAGFDVEAFVDAAKRNFVTLQDAWDRTDLPVLRSMMTDGMLAEIRSQLAERERQTSGQPNKTEVVMLEAKLLGIEDLGEHYMASVEFSGMIREDPSAGPSPFREVWNMTKPKDGASGWLVAGVQALQ